MEARKNTDNWKIYWKINVLFHTSFLAKGKFRCMWCDKEEASTSLMRSDFALAAVKCSAGHVPNFDPDQALGVCFDCDAQLVERVTERRQECFQRGCRRFAMVDKASVVRRLGKTGLVERYLALVDSFRAFDCEACWCETITPEQFQELQATSKCQHDPTHCRGCLESGIESSINAGEWRSIKCPHQHCQEELTPRDVHQFVSPQVFKMYNKEKTFEALSKNPNYRTCHDSACGNGQLVDVKVDAAPHWKCSRCGKSSCFLCKEAGHASETCEQSRKLNPQREEVEAAIRKMCKRCPKRGCRRYIHKIRGCTHMTCVKSAGSVGCGTIFCWKCKVIFAPDNGHHKYRHIVGCPMAGGRFEAKGLYATVVRPGKGDPLYEEGWDQDPDYEAGGSDTEAWR